MTDRPAEAGRAEPAPAGTDQPAPGPTGERPELRTIPVAGRHRAHDLPPPPRPPGQPPPALAAPTDPPAPASPAGSSRLREDLLANPRRTIRWLYEEDHPDWRLDRNATFALPPAVWDTLTRHCADIGVPAKRLITALAAAYLTERGIPIEQTPRH